MRGLSGKTAIVTGGASGIGKAICMRLAEEGSRLGIFDLNGEGAEATGLSLSSYQRGCREALAELGRALAPETSRVKDILDPYRPVQ